MLALVRYSGIFQILISFYSTLIRECDCSSNVTSITPKPTFDCKEVQGVVCKKDADCGKRGSCTGTFNVHRNTFKYVDSIYLPELQIKQTKNIWWGITLESILNLVQSHCALWNHKWNIFLMNCTIFIWKGGSCQTPFCIHIGGFQLEFVSVSQVINSALSLVEITAFRLESKSCKGFFLLSKFSMWALEFTTSHVIYNPA